MLPDQPEILRVLHGHAGWNRLHRSLTGERTEIGALARDGMFQDASLHGNFGRRHVPIGGGCRNKHGAGGGTGPTQLLPGIGNSSTTAGALDLTKQQIVVAGGIRWRGFGAHLRPIRIELFGNDGGKPRIGTLPHLDMLDDDRHRVVGSETHEGIGGQHVLCLCGCAGTAGPMKADRQSRRRGGRTL